MNRLFTEHTPALNTPENLHTVKLKFSPPLPSPPELNPHLHTRSSTAIPSISYSQSFCMPPPLTSTQPYFRHTKRGKASGPFADIIDIPRVVGLIPSDTTIPDPTPLNQLLGTLAAGLLPPSLHQTFSSIYFLSLWKDEPKTKLHPIGIGLALRRILATIYAQQHAADFAD
jgi:hypothetical protein